MKTFTSTIPYKINQKEVGTFENSFQTKTIYSVEIDINEAIDSLFTEDDSLYIAQDLPQMKALILAITREALGMAYDDRWGWRLFEGGKNKNIFRFTRHAGAKTVSHVYHTYFTAKGGAIDDTQSTDVSCEQGDREIEQSAGE